MHFLYTTRRAPSPPLFPSTTLFRSVVHPGAHVAGEPFELAAPGVLGPAAGPQHLVDGTDRRLDRKSTRLNSSHVAISYAVFCLKKKPESSASPDITSLIVQRICDSR